MTSTSRIPTELEENLKIHNLSSNAKYNRPVAVTFYMYIAERKESRVESIYVLGGGGEIQRPFLSQTPVPPYNPAFEPFKNANRKNRSWGLLSKMS